MSAYKDSKVKACLGCTHIVQPASCIIMSESSWTTLDLKKLRFVYHEVGIYYINVGGTKHNLTGQKLISHGNVGTDLESGPPGVPNVLQVIMF